MTDNFNKQREMWRKATKKYKLNHIDKARECEKECRKQYYNQHKESVKAYQKEYMKRPEIKAKDKIRAVTRREFKNNKIFCSQCGSLDNLEFHHTDNKVDSFVVLCRDCHRALHRSREGRLLRNAN